MTPAEIERMAIVGAEMPDSLSGPDQLLFLSFRSLYQGIRSGTVARDQGKREKSRLLSEHRIACLNYRMWAQTVRMRKDFEAQLVLMRKSGCEVCRTTADIFDGMVRVNERCE